MTYVWECNKCGGTMKLNYDATEEDYHRLKNCGCRQQGTFEWKYNTYDDEEIYKG